MLRRGFRMLRQGLAGLILLVLSLCALEVGLRISDAARSGRKAATRMNCAAPWCFLSQPSSRTYLELKPLSAARVRSPESGEPIELRINSFGWRGAEPVVPKPRDVFRILWLGDESLLAADGTDAETLAALLQTELEPLSSRRVEVINGGIPGGCPLTEYLHFRGQGLAVQPDLVLVQFNLGDVADHQQRQRFTQLDANGRPLTCLHPAANSKAKAIPTKRWCEQLRLLDVGSREASRMWKEHASEDHLDDPWKWLRERDAQALPPAIKPVAQLAELLKSGNVPVVLIGEPLPWQISPTASPGGKLRAGLPDDAYFPDRGPWTVLETLAAHSGIEFCDLSRGFAPGGGSDRFFLRQSPNLSRAGRELCARLVTQFLQDRIQGPWNATNSIQDRDSTPVGTTGFRK